MDPESGQHGGPGRRYPCPAGLTGDSLRVQLLPRRLRKPSAILELSDRIRLKLPSYTDDAFIEHLTLAIPLSGVLPVCTIQATVASSMATPPPPPPPSTVPSRPAAPSLRVDSDHANNRYWGGSAVMEAAQSHPTTGRYRVTGSGAAWTDRFDVTDLVQVFTGLDASTEYDFRFRATEQCGRQSVFVRCAGHHRSNRPQLSQPLHLQTIPAMPKRGLRTRPLLHHRPGGLWQPGAHLCGCEGAWQRASPSYDQYPCSLRYADQRRWAVGRSPYGRTNS